MSDLTTQRNVAIGVAAVAVAFVAGYVISSGGGSSESLVSPPAAAAAAAVAPESAPTDDQELADAAAGDFEDEGGATPVASTRPAERSAPPVGTRRRAAAESATPVPEPRDESRERPADPSEDEAFSSVGSAPSAPVRRLVRVEIPRSTPIVLDLVAEVSSRTAQVGDPVVAELAEPLRVDGTVVVAKGTRVTGRVSEVQTLRKVGGKSILALSFDRLESGDGGAAIAAGFRREGKSETGKDAATIGAGAAIGTILGNQAKKNDRGKLIGAIVGAAAGAAVAAKTEGEHIELPAGARLELTLQNDVELMVDR